MYIFKYKFFSKMNSESLVYIYRKPLKTLKVSLKKQIHLMFIFEREPAIFSKIIICLSYWKI